MHNAATRPESALIESQREIPILVIKYLPELRNGSSQHEGNSPIDGDNGSPEQLARSSGKSW